MKIVAYVVVSNATGEDVVVAAHRNEMLADSHVKELNKWSTGNHYRWVRCEEKSP
jgi:hypothetical protein